jgi:signal-transduction protein with cAMP-binding, CBS, and nucleotidyltransferase domain
MHVIDTVRRAAVAVEPSHTVAEVATLMESAGVGAVAVVDGGELTGIVTDRDIVTRCVAKRSSLDARIDSVMSAPVLTIDGTADLHDAFAVFRDNAVRRLAVVRDGRFAGMVSVDDLLIDLSADLADLTRPVMAEVVFGHHDVGVPATR